MKPPPQLDHLKLQHSLVALPKRNRREQVLTLSSIQICVFHNIRPILFRKATDITTFLIAAFPKIRSRNNAPTKLLAAILHQKAVVNRGSKIALEKWLNGFHSAVAFSREVDEYVAVGNVLDQKFVNLDLVVETV